MTLKKIALIPAYKPGAEMLATVRALCENGFHVVVVNDGSGDAWKSAFDAAAHIADVISHDANRGKGAALKTGMQYIREHFEPPFIVVTADADGQHRTEDILRVSEAAGKSPNALILGSRSFDRKVPLRSRFGNTVTRAVYRIAAGQNVRDTQTGLRAFSDRLLPELLAVEGCRYEYEMNVLMEMPRRAVPIREVGIQTVYIDGNASSHFDTIKDSCRIYKGILRYSASSLISFLADYGLFCLLSLLTGSAVISNIAARVCSSALNFTLNRRFVFRSDSSLKASAVRYFALAVLVLTLNTLILKALSLTGLNAYAAKLITETLLFLFSYIAQRLFVFRKERITA